MQGLKVIHKRVAGEPLASAIVLFDRNELFRDAEVAHAQYLLMRLISWWGSQDYIESWDSELGRIGATHTAVCAADYAYTGVVAPATSFDHAFHLLARAVLAPPIADLTDDYFDTIKAGYRQELETADDDPANAATQAGFSLISDKHPYNLRVQQLAQLEKVNVEVLSTAKFDLFDRQRATIVVVGDIERARLEALVNQELFQLIAVTSRKPHLDPVAPLHTSPERVRVVTMDEAPNWEIRGYFPSVSAVDQARFAALQLGARVLSQRLFDEVRDELGLAYSIQLSIRNFRAAYGMLSLGTVEPVDAMRKIRENIDRIRSEGISDAELDAARATYLTEMLAQSQGAYGLALKLGDWELTAGDSALLDSHLSALRDVSAADATSEVGSALSELRYGAAGPGTPLDEHTLFADDADASVP